MSNVHEKTGQMYDAIDADDLDRAIRIGEKSDMRPYALPQSLLAYCYAMKKRLQESLDTCRLVMRMRPTDEGTLNALGQAMKMCRKEDELALFYETLVASYPQNSLYMQKLFAMHIKTGDCKKMQLLAQKLYKSDGDRKYVFWTVSSMLQQNDLPSMMLAVAEKMIHKLFYESASTKSADTNNSAMLAQPGAEEIELYVEVLLRQGKFTEALQALKQLHARPRGVPINAGEDFLVDGSRVKMHLLRFHSLCADILRKIISEATDEAVKQTQIRELKETHRTILSLYPDQWSSHQELISLEVISALDTSSSAVRDATATVAHRAYLQNIHQKNPHLRGPLLAEMTLLCVWGLNEDMPSTWQRAAAPENYFGDKDTRRASKELGVLICQYIFNFKTKQCCFSDIKRYMEAIATDSETLQAIEAWATSHGTEVEQKLIQLVEPAATGEEDGKAKTKKKSKSKKNKGTEVTEDVRNQAVLLLCSYVKLKQVAAFAVYLTTGSSLSADLGSAQVKALEFFESTRHLCVGSIGGEKEVQPGDEILQLNSIQHRALQALEGIHIDNIEHRAKRYMAASQWGDMLYAGIKASPFSYALKLEMLSPLRELASAQMAWDLFTELKVRHVQTDSLSFLILPALLEGGLFTEARKQHLQVLAFHRSSTRDTAEMIAESFQHANYMKGLEMKKFSGFCANSIQLALTNAEYPLIEILEAYHGPHMWRDVAKYLEDYVAHDAMPLLDIQALTALRSNNDYSLLIRCDATTQQESADAAQRTLQYCARIREGQLTVRLLAAAINGDAETAQKYLDPLLEAVFARLEESSSNSVNIENITLNGISASSDTLQWNQEVHNGGKDFELAVWKAIQSVLKLCLSAARMLRFLIMGNDDKETKELRNNVETKLPQSYKESVLNEADQCSIQLQVCLQSLQAVQNALLIESRHLRTSTSGNVMAPLDPMWLQRCSFFARTLAPWATLLLKAASQSYCIDNTKSESGSFLKNVFSDRVPGSSSNSSNIAAGSVESSQEIEQWWTASTQNVKHVIDQVVDAMTKLMDSFQKLLAKEEGVSLPVDNLDALCRAIDETSAQASEMTQSELASKIFSGQRTTVRRLRTLLEVFLNWLKH